MELSLAAESLRTSGVEIYGAAKGLDAQTMDGAYRQVVRWARSGALTVELTTVALEDIETVWQRADPAGQRLVVLP